MFAKLALGTTSLVWSDAWLESDTAKRLQEWVRDENLPLDSEGLIAEPMKYDEPLIQAAAVPPKHLLTLRSIGHGRALFIVGLFGSTFYATVFEDEPASVDRAWLLDPLMRTVEATDLAGLIPYVAEGLRRTQAV
jgi:hypothetical protein